MRISKGSYCSAINCFNNRGQNKKLSFFRFPKDPVRCEQWVLNTGRIELLQKHSMHLYHNCRLCAYHFEDEMFMNSNKTSLIHNAIPTLFPDPNPPRVVPVQRKVSRQKRKYYGKLKQRVAKGDPRVKPEPGEHSESLAEGLENFRVVTVKTEVMGDATVEEYLIDLRTDSDAAFNTRYISSFPFSREEMANIVTANTKESLQSDKSYIQSLPQHKAAKPCHRPGNGDEYILVCDICGMEYHQMYSLKKHKLTHLHDNPFECRICNKNFRALGSLKRHVISHLNST